MTPTESDTTNSASAPQERKNSDNQPQWLKAGDNPYDAEILDISDFTQNAVATKYNESVVESFNESRADDGKKYEAAAMVHGQAYQANIVYPLNELSMEGVIFKAESMEVKWDIYAYNSWLFFVKSWTGELAYKAHFVTNGDTFVIDKVITGAVARMSSTDEEKETYAAQNVHSMIQTHIMNTAWPYKIPEMMRGIPEELIASHMFALFGSKATLATHANVLNIKK
ncbi:MAG: hypothetical protein KAG34_00525 [Cocleimonas sp.]|nr:hypothetical protein [Cocleimonas sp.]